MLCKAIFLLQAEKEGTINSPVLLLITLCSHQRGGGGGVLIDESAVLHNERTRRQEIEDTGKVRMSLEPLNLRHTFQLSS